jgi:hypothetical protein
LLVQLGVVVGEAVFKKNKILKQQILKWGKVKSIEVIIF